MLVKLLFVVYLYLIFYNNFVYVDWCLYLNKKIILECIWFSKEGILENINELMGFVFRIVEKRFEIWILILKIIIKKILNIMFGFVILVVDLEGLYLFKIKIVILIGLDIII